MCPKSANVSPFTVHKECIGNFFQKLNCYYFSQFYSIHSCINLIDNLSLANKSYGILIFRSIFSASFLFASSPWLLVTG
ncbi:MAG: hypothetical protein QG591_943 [Planctomycetota bacterium]|nr:hypothetical protein [Planctomycetota bacterium]